MTWMVRMFCHSHLRHATISIALNVAKSSSEFGYSFISRGCIIWIMHAFDRQQLSEVGCCWVRSVPYLAYLGWVGTVYLMNFLPKIPYIHRIYMVLANPLHINCCAPPNLKVYLKSAACCFLHVRHALKVCQEYKSITDLWNWRHVAFWPCQHKPARWNHFYNMTSPFIPSIAAHYTSWLQHKV